MQVSTSFLSSVLAADSVEEAAGITQDQLGRLSGGAGAGDREAVRRAEVHVSRAPEVAFRPVRQSWQLEFGTESWSAGEFRTPTVAELEAGLPAGGAGGSLSFSILDGASPVTDIGGLQATAPAHCLFQVASQFNCLEAPGPHLVPVSAYFRDPTQGPRAAIGAFPATLLRHYFAPGPDGGRFEQETGGAQIELLASACGEGVAPNGYLTGEGVADPRELAERLEAQWKDVQVGLHTGVDVVLGFDWDGAVPPDSELIGQVMTSTVAGGYYGAERALGASAFRRVLRSLLRAAYVGTLMAAAAQESDWVVLTLIGGGVFGNPIEEIWESILEATDQITPLLTADLHVVLNGRQLASKLDREAVLLPAVIQRSGRLLTFDGTGLVGLMG